MELQLKNIGMIKEASVKIDGLTVIAGENDTGKSTVGKALFLYLHTMTSNENANSLARNVFGYGLSPSDNPEIGIDNEDENCQVLFVETPLVWNFTDFFRDIAQVESQMGIELDYPYLMKDLNFKLHIKSASNGLDIKERVTSLMGGEFKKDEIGRYYFDKQGQRIELVNTATGIKYFGIFQILSENNYLNENSILVLDEPEVHLHPKWQLEMAKIIVALVKNGVKIVVNSHSPYMIEALELYSKKEEINSNFYLAEKENDYAIISDVTDNLEPIYSKLAKPIQDLEDESLENFKW
ncbi:ABC transporter ATP-binding protein [hydrothermal vent metagenome]|uniref:ABC transporter ATP-binding protein n=1 Tax=hydrothermal vent metagenome TaxID=652676 RepID=A0A1W1CEG1_9ZZZZ